MLELSIAKLESRFLKIDYDEYYLSYSGGKDSHLLYWFIKNYLKDDKIKIVGVNTFREHSEIRERIYNNCNDVLVPELSMTEINKQYGMPCFTKTQDDFIHRYQKGTRTESTLKYVERRRNEDGQLSFFALNKLASELTLSNKLHKVSNKCCDFTKKRPLKKYEKENDKKAILGVRGVESLRRKSAYSTCLHKNQKFTPLFDFTNADIDEIYDYYNIDIPKIYEYTSRTGCVGCPYARKKELIESFSQATKSQQKYAINSFKESYEVKGILEEILEIYNKKEVIV